LKSQRPFADLRLRPIQPLGGVLQRLPRFIVRSMPDALMETFDYPDPSLLAPKRSTTVTALQWLRLLNDPLVLGQAERLAQSAAKSGAYAAEQIAAA
jgi:hypothetical protein